MIQILIAALLVLATQAQTGTLDFSDDVWTCAAFGCDRSSFTQGDDWDYYSETNDDCDNCRSLCAPDANCAAYTCDDGYCSWWKKDTSSWPAPSSWNNTDEVQSVCTHTVSDNTDWTCRYKAVPYYILLEQHQCSSKNWKNHGTFSSAEGCAISANSDPYCQGYFQWSPSYPSWGCKCCNPVAHGSDMGSYHGSWNLYHYGCRDTREDCLEKKACCDSDTNVYDECDELGSTTFSYLCRQTCSLCHESQYDSCWVGDTVAAKDSNGDFILGVAVSAIAGTIGIVNDVEGAIAWPNSEVESLTNKNCPDRNFYRNNCVLGNAIRAQYNNSGTFEWKAGVIDWVNENLYTTNAVSYIVTWDDSAPTQEVESYRAEIWTGSEFQMCAEHCNCDASYGETSCVGGYYSDTGNDKVWALVNGGLEEGYVSDYDAHHDITVKRTILPSYTTQWDLENQQVFSSINSSCPTSWKESQCTLNTPVITNNENGVRSSGTITATPRFGVSTVSFDDSTMLDVLNSQIEIWDDDMEWYTPCMAHCNCEDDTEQPTLFPTVVVSLEELCNNLEDASGGWPTGYHSLYAPCVTLVNTTGLDGFGDASLGQHYDTDNIVDTDISEQGGFTMAAGGSISVDLAVALEANHVMEFTIGVTRGSAYDTRYSFLDCDGTEMAGGYFMDDNYDVTSSLDIYIETSEYNLACFSIECPDYDGCFIGPLWGYWALNKQDPHTGIYMADIRPGNKWVVNDNGDPNDFGPLPNFYSSMEADSDTMHFHWTDKRDGVLSVDPYFGESVLEVDFTCITEGMARPALELVGAKVGGGNYFDISFSRNLNGTIDENFFAAIWTDYSEEENGGFNVILQLYDPLPWETIVVQLSIGYLAPYVKIYDLDGDYARSSFLTPTAVGGDLELVHTTGQADNAEVDAFPYYAPDEESGKGVPPLSFYPGEGFDVLDGYPLGVYDGRDGNLTYTLTDNIRAMSYPYVSMAFYELDCDADYGWSVTGGGTEFLASTYLAAEDDPGIGFKQMIPLDVSILSGLDEVIYHQWSAEMQPTGEFVKNSVIGFYDPWFLGCGDCKLNPLSGIGDDSIKVVEDATTFDNTTGLSYVVVQFHGSYDLTQISFAGVDPPETTWDSVVSLYGDFVVVDFPYDDCLTTMATTISVSEMLAHGATTDITGDQITLYVKIELTEELEDGSLREIVEHLPVSYELTTENTLTLVAEAAVYIEPVEYQEVIYKMQTDVAVYVASMVMVEYRTTLNYPWQLDPNSYAVSDPDNLINGNLTLIETGNCSSIAVGEDCVQTWQMHFHTDGCDQSGTIYVNFTAVAGDEEGVITIPMIIAISQPNTDCAVEVAGVMSLSGQLTTYEDSNYTTPETNFYIGSTVFYKAEFFTLGQVDEITASSMALTQPSKSLNLVQNDIAPTFINSDVEQAESRTVYFSVVLDNANGIHASEAGIATSLSTTWELSYADISQRRRLTSESWGMGNTISLKTRGEGSHGTLQHAEPTSAPYQLLSIVLATACAFLVAYIMWHKCVSKSAYSAVGTETAL